MVMERYVMDIKIDMQYYTILCETVENMEKICDEKKKSFGFLLSAYYSIKPQMVIVVNGNSISCVGIGICIISLTH